MMFGSVCSGIEAASVAWDPIGWSAAWFAEIEPFPAAVLAHHWPWVDNLGDMTKIADMVRAKKVIAPDVLVGGTPCQAFSVAGLRGGLSDGRGQLTLEFVRLANAIDEQRKQPAIIVWENVPGVLSSTDNAFGCFLAGLAGEDQPLVAPGKKWANAGCVFGPQRTVAWRVLDAQYFGVAQRRRRVFVVASARDDFDPTSVLFESDGVRRDTAPSREAGKAVAALTAHGVGVSGADDNQAQAGHIVGALTAKGPATNGAPEVDAGHILAQVDTVGALDTECGFQRGTHQSINAGHLLPVGFRLVSFGEYSPDGTASTMKARDYKDATDLAVAYGFNSNAQVDQMRVNVETAETMTCSQYPAVVHAVAYLPATPLGIFQDSQYGVQQYDSAGTLRAGRIPEHQMVMQPPTLQVRRLTPTECERLQGFPDGHTLIQVKGKPAADGPRYKALGNSMAVPVMRWIGLRISLANALNK